VVTEGYFGNLNCCARCFFIVLLERSPRSFLSPGSRVIIPVERSISGHDMPQHEGRIKLAVPVAVIVQENSNTRILPAQTVDASANGARVKDLPAEVSVGQLVTVVYGERQCMFRIAWIGTTGTPWEGQVGMECLDASKNLWNFDFRDSNIFSLDALIFPWEGANPS
jgi:PilZ domain